MSDQTDDGPSARKRLTRGALVLVPVAAVAYALLLGVGDIGESIDVLLDLNPLIILAALLLEVVTVLSLAQVYRSSLAAVGGEVTYSEGLETSMSAFTITQVIPGGGAFGVVVATRRLMGFGASRAAAAAAPALSGILAMLTLGIVVSAGIVVSVLTSDFPVGALIASLAVVVVLGFVAVLLFKALNSAAVANRFLDLAQKPLERFKVDLTVWRASFVEVAENGPTIPQLARVVGWSVVNWTTDIAALWLVLAGLGEPISMGVLLLAFGIENLAVMIPISPGGVGLVEAGMSGVLVAFGVPGAIAVAGILGYRLFAYWLPLLAGIPQYLRTPEPAAA